MGMRTEELVRVSALRARVSYLALAPESSAG